MSDDLVLSVNGTAISGWTSVRVTRGIERCPSDFDIEMTDLFPGDATAVIVQTGDACTVKLGADLVVTGFVDKVAPSFDETSHSIRVTGRGRMQDAIDCSAEWPGGQFSQMNALQIATALVKPYGISVTAPDGPGPVVPQFNLMIGETPWEIIERICRFAGLLCYEDPEGNLVLARTGDKKAASGFTEGLNILAARGEYSQDQRFSEYDAFLTSFDQFQDLGNAGNLVATAKDPSVGRHRKLYIVADAGASGYSILQDRVNWEANRRWGRGNILTLTADSWRDSAGALWTPNTIAPVSVPNLHDTRQSLQRVISEVSYLRDARGTCAEVTLMTPQAFTSEPIVIAPSHPNLTTPPAK